MKYSITQATNFARLLNIREPDNFYEVVPTAKMGSSWRPGDCETCRPVRKPLMIAVVRNFE